MPLLRDVVAVLEQLAPLSLAEDWDNVGLLVGASEWPVERVMTCLTLTPETVAEAVAGDADLVVSHHPLPFRPIAAITDASTPGALLLELISHRVAVYSAHTAFDSAQAGINQHFALGLGLQAICPLLPAVDDDGDLGAGRYGLASEPQNLREVAELTKKFLGTETVRVVGDEGQSCERIAIACGSGGSFLEAARQAGCDVLVTGEATFHTCLEAKACEMGLILAGHFASERFALLSLADYLTEQLASIQAWASRDETDPLQTL